MDNDPDQTQLTAPTQAVSSSEHMPGMLGPLATNRPFKRKRRDSNDEMLLFRRVRIYSVPVNLILPAPLSSILQYRLKVYELRLNDWHDRGTGMLSIRTTPQVWRLVWYIRVIMSDDDRKHSIDIMQPQQKAFLHVLSEAWPTVVLHTPIEEQELGFQKQQGIIFGQGVESR